MCDAATVETQSQRTPRLQEPKSGSQYAVQATRDAIIVARAPTLSSKLLESRLVASGKGIRAERGAVLLDRLVRDAKISAPVLQTGLETPEKSRALQHSKGVGHDFGGRDQKAGGVAFTYFDISPKYLASSPANQTCTPPLRISHEENSNAKLCSVSGLRSTPLEADLTIDPSLRSRAQL